MGIAEDFLADCQLRRMKTASTYYRYVRRYCAFLEARRVRPQDVTRPDLKAFLEAFRERDVKQRSLDHCFACLSTFYEYLVEEGQVETNPIIPFRRRYLKGYKEEVPDPRQLISVEQMAMLISSILDSRDKAIVTLLAKTGMRRAELAALDVDDVSLERMEVMLKPTAKRSNRLLYFDYETANILAAWIRARENREKTDRALFPSRVSSRISPSEVHKLVILHATRVGLHIPESKRQEERFTPHCCRHWFTTYLIRSGMSRDFVKELRGDVRNEAVDIYNHIDRKELRESYMAHIPQLGI